MELKLIRASVQDTEKIWKMQIEAFSELLDRYQDYDTSPGNERIERIRWKLEQDNTFFYFIEVDGQTVGAIRVVDYSNNERKRIAPIFVMPEYRNCGIAQKAIAKAEEFHGALYWKLDTIMQEKGNCYLYEKMGYHQTGETEIINDKMTIVFYEKD